MPWDTDGELNKCFQKRQFQQFENLYDDIGSKLNTQEVVDKFGCKLPCHYTEYKLVEKGRSSKYVNKRSNLPVTSLLYY